MDSKGRTRRSTSLYKNEKKRKNEKIEEENEDVLEGLEIDGGYVKIDQNLLKRLKPDVEEIPKEASKDDSIKRIREVFQDSPGYADFLIYAKPITPEYISELSTKLDKNHLHKKMAEMVANIPLEFLALQRTGLYTEDYEYRYKPAINPRVTNQFHSGRCWMMASLNVLRYDFIAKYNLDPKFEFSASYLYFWDKIERSKMFYESIWALAEEPVDSRYNNMIISPSSHLLNDGGYFSYFQNLVNKYGLVPKSIYNDSYNCMSSDEMNDVLIKILDQDALEIRQLKFRNEFDAYISKRMPIIYGLVVKFMGEPPTKFDWRYENESGQYQEIKNLTPLKFYKVLVPHNSDKMTFIHDPRHPENYYKPHHVEYGTNMIGGETAIFINVPIEVLKYGISESIINGEPVWFGCNICESLDMESGIMDVNRYDYKRVLGTDIMFSKADMLITKTSLPVHAMTINGVDMDSIDSENRVYRKWRVENSWGIQGDLDSHPDHGYMQMSDAWFDQYVYMAVLDLKYFQEETLELIMKNREEEVVIRAWDAFGTLAVHTGCNSCKSHTKKSFNKSKHLPK